MVQEQFWSKELFNIERVNKFVLSWVVLCVCLHSVVHSQQSDFVGLASARLVQPIDRFWSVQYAGQAMFNENLHELWMGFGELSVHRKLNKHFSTAFYYRLIGSRKVNDHYQQRNALFHTISYHHAFGPWVFSIRSRNQITRYGELGETPIRTDRWYSRNKISLKRRFNYYYSASGSFEIFAPLNGMRKFFPDQYRYTISFESRINRFIETGCYYQLQHIARKANINRYFVLGLQTTITLP